MKELLILIALALATLQGLAADVSTATAQQVAQRFLSNRAAKGTLNAASPTVKWVHKEANSSNANQAAYYVINTDRGFVIVSGDDRAQQILAYGDRPLDGMSNLPENMRFWLGHYKQQMEYLQAHPGMVVKKPTFKAGQSVQPMLDAMWNQSEPYNNLCPRDGDKNAMTGCACTSLAQVFNFWKHPTEPTAVVPGYTTRNGKFTLPDLPSVTFDWDNILPTYTFNNYNDANALAVAQLMRYIGQAEQMNYDKTGSDAWEDDIVRACEILGYDDAYAVYKATMNFQTGDETTYISDEDWHAMMVEELLAGRPFVFCAFDYTHANSSYSGHAFNVDGYDASNGTFSINWGWSGVGNGYFAMNAFANQGANYHLGQRIVKNIKPAKASEPALKTTPALISLATRVGEPVTATFTVKGRALSSDVKLTVNDADGVYSIDPATITASAVVDGYDVTVTYAPRVVGSNEATVTLSADGVDDMVLRLHGVASEAYELQAVDPVMLPASAQYVGNNSFRAEWADQTDPNEVVSYTLQVDAKQDYMLLGEADWSNVDNVISAQTANAARYFPEGWTFAGADFYTEGEYISINGNFSFSTPTYDLTGFDKVTVVLTAKMGGYSASKFTVSTSVDSKEFEVTERTFGQFVAVLDCGKTDKVTIANKSGNPCFQHMVIYAGELPAPQLRATESGDESQRTITGITDRFYTINNLTPGGTYLYKVKALYANGAWSAWSNVQEVTLAEGGQTYAKGDVNKDGFVNITDVTTLIDMLLSDESAPEADVDGDGTVSITDVTTLIDLLLSA